MHHRPMCHSRFGVKAGLDQLRIGQEARELLGREMINKDLIRAGAGGELAVRRERNGVDRIQPLGQWLPFDGPDDGGRGFGALINPEFDETQFFRGQVRCLDLVGGRRHDGVLDLMRGGFQHQAGTALLRRRGRSGVTAFKNILGRFQDEPALGCRLVVTGEAVVLENRQNLVVEINRLGVFEFGDGNGFGGIDDGFRFIGSN